MHAGDGLASQFSQRLERLLFFADLEQLIRRFGHHDETADEHDRYNGADYAEYQIRHVGADRIRIQETDGDEQLQERSQSPSHGYLFDYKV